MSDRQAFELAKWASQVADRYNKSITYVLMKMHEAMGVYEDIEVIKMRVLEELRLYEFNTRM